MPIATKYLFIVSMDVTKEKEALFNEVYDTEHVPLLMKVPGVKAVSRMKTEPAAFNLAGERKLLDGGSEPNYVAIYEIGRGGGERPLAQRGTTLHLEPPAHRAQGDLGHLISSPVTRGRVGWGKATQTICDE